MYFPSCLRINSLIPRWKDVYRVPSTIGGAVRGAENTFGEYLNHVFKDIKI